VKLSQQEAKTALPYPDDKSDYLLVWEPIFSKPGPKRPRGAVAKDGLTSPDREWLKTLRRGDKAVLAATIAKISLRHTHVGEYAPPHRGHYSRHFYWQVYFEDAVLEPK
jgi:hypothetical protein